MPIVQLAEIIELTFVICTVLLGGNRFKLLVLTLVLDGYYSPFLFVLLLVLTLE